MYRYKHVVFIVVMLEYFYVTIAKDNKNITYHIQNIHTKEEILECIMKSYPKGTCMNVKQIDEILKNRLTKIQRSFTPSSTKIVEECGDSKKKCVSYNTVIEKEKCFSNPIKRSLAYMIFRCK